MLDAWQFCVCILFIGWFIRGAVFHARFSQQDMKAPPLFFFFVIMALFYIFELPVVCWGLDLGLCTQ